MKKKNKTFDIISKILSIISTIILLVFGYLITKLNIIQNKYLELIYVVVEII